MPHPNHNTHYTIRAEDSSGNIAVNDSTINITVSDTNNNAPVFIQPFYEFTIPENWNKSEAFAQVLAIDTDPTGNKITYKILDEHSLYHNPFVINNVTGHLILSIQLDYEKVQNYSIIVIAEDSGSVKRSSFVTVKFLLKI